MIERCAYGLIPLRAIKTSTREGLTILRTTSTSDLDVFAVWLI